MLPRGARQSRGLFAGRRPEGRGSRRQPFAFGLTAIKGLMRRLILLIALLPGVAAAAEQPKKKAPQVSVNPCAQYGAGFVQVQGTTTCVKLSGSVRVDIGRSGPAR